MNLFKRIWDELMKEPETRQLRKTKSLEITKLEARKLLEESGWDEVRRKRSKQPMHIHTGKIKVQLEGNKKEKFPFPF